ncbi:Hypothetical predicted protein [Octopus vulgaris]|uniref:Uncharacterized protein n=1 Tax=Octopus vulgaris TaxID=6645 RepID=A0AA36AU91_OCTVU|nr:Hypothetical predicted protein [Octopus vulgaris]
MQLPVNVHNSVELLIWSRDSQCSLKVIRGSMFLKIMSKGSTAKLKKKLGTTDLGLTKCLYAYRNHVSVRIHTGVFADSAVCEASFSPCLHRRGSTHRSEKNNKHKE